MKKLLKLLNEHAHTYADHYDDTGEEITITFFSHADQCFQCVCDGKYETLVDDTVISKRFGFIGWLIENDKIDRDNQALQYAKSDLSKFFAEWKDKDGMSDDYAMLLMLLAIQDEPINLLISMLK